MRIIEFSAMDTSGAGIAAIRYHHLLQSMGHNCTLYVSSKHQNDPSIIELSDKKPKRQQFKKMLKEKLRRLTWLKRLYRRMFPVNNYISALNTYCYYNYDELRTKPNEYIFSKVDIYSIDVIFIYWLGNFLNTTDIKYLYEKTGARVIFSMMDMEPISGGCHYFWECKNYQTNCFNCPALPYEKQEFSHLQLQKRAQNTAYINAEIFSSSLYDIQAAKSSIINFKEYWQLYYSIDENIFYPSDRKQNNEKIYLFSNADEINNPRKGFWLLLQILFYLDRNLSNIQIVFLCLDKSIFNDYKFKNIKFEEFVFCSNVDELADIYRRADIFLCTSIEDAAPMMLAEALMCGLPTVAFDIGTAKQFIEDEIDGYVVNKYDTIGFAGKVVKLIQQRVSILSFSNKERIHKKMVSLYGIKAVKERVDLILKSEIN
ncbi:hypothetical protein FACS189491_09420 [Spirochaetia bacterium]|nr:hypothetical protein FACS189491_09420 [Spirochaetia bacterium]